MNFKALKQNDFIDIISIGTACNQDEIKKIKKLVEGFGLKPQIFLEKATTSTKAVSHEFPSFKAETRFAQLKKAAENPESQIIWNTRGGYGSADILPFLKKLPKPKQPKIFIGFSDVVSVATLLQQEWGWKIICAPMLVQLALNKVSKKSEKAILDLLFGKISKLEYRLKILNSVASVKSIKSVTTGGCISVLAGNFGTKNQLDWHNKILFLEDEGEDGERLERYFNQIVTIMVEQKKLPKAILLGNFLEANPHGTPKGKNIAMAIEKFVQKIAGSKLKIPVYAEKSGVLGHSKNMMPLVLGCETVISDGILTQKVY